MASWNELTAQLDELGAPRSQSDWLSKRFREEISKVAAILGRPVIFYFSGAFDKVGASSSLTSVTASDLNLFMSMVHGLQTGQGLALMLHTPGGSVDATETVVSYLMSKFSDITTVIPTYAMSAGTMIALASNRLIMGRQSQLGPIDGQIPQGSCQGILAQFAQARNEIQRNPELARLWAPLIGQLGPDTIIRAQHSTLRGHDLVKTWLQARMFSGNPDAVKLADEAARFFNDAGNHLSHGRRIDREAARGVAIKVDDLESDDNELQDAVLTAYHLARMITLRGSSVKLVANSLGAITYVNVV